MEQLEDRDDARGGGVLSFSGKSEAEWLPFTLENLEMERDFAQSMEDDEEEDLEDDCGRRRRGSSEAAMHLISESGSADADGKQEPPPRSPQRTGAAMACPTVSYVAETTTTDAVPPDLIPPPKAALDLVKPEAKEVQGEMGRRNSAVAPDSDEDDDGDSHHGGSHHSGQSHGGHHGGGSGRAGDKRRLERNAREQKRSLKISQKIDELRKILKVSGVPAKSSKSSILHEATQYIRQLQQRQAQIEAERAQFMQLLQREIPGGVSGMPAPAGRPSLPPAGGGGGTYGPPQLAPSSHANFFADAAAGPPPPSATAAATGARAAGPATAAATVGPVSGHDYQLVFQSAAVPMAIASVNGALVDCNLRLSLATGYTREELLTLTIFNLVADPFLQQTFGLISSMLTMQEGAAPAQFQVHGKTRDGRPAGIVAVALVRDDNRQPKHFAICITPAMPIF